MLALGRAIGAFFLMMVVGYLAVVLLLPAPATIGRSNDLVAGRSDAMRLAEQAQALVSHKPVGSLE